MDFQLEAWGERDRHTLTLSTLLQTLKQLDVKGEKQGVVKNQGRRRCQSAGNQEKTNKNPSSNNKNGTKYITNQRAGETDRLDVLSLVPGSGSILKPVP